MLSEIWSAAGLTVIFWMLIFAIGGIGALWSLWSEHGYEIKRYLRTRLIYRYRRAEAKIRRRRRARTAARKAAFRRREAERRERAYIRALEYCNRGI